MNVRNLNVQPAMLLGGVMLCGLGGAVAEAQTVVSAVAAEELIDPLETVDVEMFVNHTGDVDALAAYQGNCEVSGGDSGTLDLDDLEIDYNNTDWVFYDPPRVVWDCTGYYGDYLCAALDRPNQAVAVENPGYLGTMTYLASSDAQGVFDVDVDTDPNVGTILLDSENYLYSYSIDDPAEVGVDIECFADGHCDDDNDCTTDTCTSAVCSNDNVSYGTLCDDGLFCTPTDECDGNGTCVGSGTRCRGRTPKCCEPPSAPTCVCAGCLCSM